MNQTQVPDWTVHTVELLILAHALSSAFSLHTQTTESEGAVCRRDGRGKREGAGCLTWLSTDPKYEEVVKLTLPLLTAHKALILLTLILTNFQNAQRHPHVHIGHSSIHGLWSVHGHRQHHWHCHTH